MTTKWEIRTEPAGPGVNMLTGEVYEEDGLRVRYRPHGSRGRFCGFVLLGKVPKRLDQVIDEYNATRGPRNWRGKP